MPDDSHDDELEPDNEIIAEVRAIRKAIWNEAGGTWEGYIAHIQAVEAALRAEGWTFLEPARRAPRPDPED